MGANDFARGQSLSVNAGDKYPPKKHRKPPGTPATFSVQARGCKGLPPLA